VVMSLLVSRSSTACSMARAPVGQCVEFGDDFVVGDRIRRCAVRLGYPRSVNRPVVSGDRGRGGEPSGDVGRVGRPIPISSS
jgi:hypothetical protein